MTIGDVHSTEKGSGARFNDLKPDMSLIPLCTLEDEARVWMYGREKYAAWNWAKGMPWSVPYACALRHLAAWHRGETLDPESGLPHLAHVMCNLRMLTLYAQTYPEGDDRPVQWMPKGGEARQVFDAVIAAVDASFNRLRTTTTLCLKCGNKRCPHATDPSQACSGSNAVGQTPPTGRLNYGHPARATCSRCHSAECPSATDPTRVCPTWHEKTCAEIDECSPAFLAWYATQSHQLSNEQVCFTIWRAGWNAAKVDGAAQKAEADVARLRAILTDTDRELREAWAKRILPASALSASLCQRIEAEAEKTT